MTILYTLICIIMTAPIAKISQICLTKMLLTYNVIHCLIDVPVIRSQLFIPLIVRNHVGILILKSMPPIILSHILTGIQTLCYSLFRIMANFKDLSLASAIFLNCLQQEYLRALSSSTTREYLMSMILCLFSTYILAKLGQHAAKTMIFKTAMCRSSILLSRLLSLMEEASYQWCLRHPIQRFPRRRKRRIKSNRMAIYRYFKGKPKIRHKKFKYNPYNMNHWSNLPEETIDANIALAAAKEERVINFHPDTDYVEVGIDTQCSRSICNDKTMMRNTTSCNVRIRGIGGIIVKATVQGDWVLPITSDDGRTTIQLVPNTVLCEHAGKCLLSPQHFFQKYIPGSIGRMRGKAITTADRTVITYGNRGEFQCTVPITKETANVPILKTKPSLGSLHSYMAEHQPLIENIVCHECTSYPNQHKLPIVSDDEESINQADTSIDKQMSPSPNVLDPETDPQDENINDIAVDMPPPEMILDVNDHQPTTPTAELLQYHYRLNHCSFRKLKIMAKLRLIPHHLANVNPPICPACKFGKHTRKAWRTKAQPSTLRRATVPGEIVSVDMMESRLPGFIAQLKGTLTTARYMGAVVFVDHFSKYVHVELIRDFSSKSTVDACAAFEAKLQIWESP